MSTSLIQVKDAVKTYKNTTLFFQNIQIKKGVTLLLGENGSGKSTLLKMILEMVKYKGEIINKCSMSYMPEVTHFPNDISVSVFLQTLRTIQPTNRNVNTLLNMFHLNDKKDVPIHTLSKGMKGKLNLIQCLLKEAELYILDEPLNGLDHQTVKSLVSYIKHSKDSFLITSHVESLFDTVATDVIRL